MSVERKPGRSVTKIKISSDSPSIVSAKLFQQGTQAFMDGDFQLAVNIFIDMLNNSKNLEKETLDSLYKNLAMSYKKLGKSSDAIRVWKTHFNHIEFQAFVLYQEGTQDLLNGEPSKAIVKLTEALQGKLEKGMLKSVYNNLMAAHQQLGTKPKEIAVWQKAIDNELDESNPFVQLALYYRKQARNNIHEFTAMCEFSVNNTVIAVPQALNATTQGMVTVQNGLKLYPNDPDLEIVGLQLQIMQNLYRFDYVNAAQVAKKATIMFPAQPYFNGSLARIQEMGCIHNVSKMILDPTSDVTKFIVHAERKLPKGFCDSQNSTHSEIGAVLNFADQNIVASTSNHKPSRTQITVIDENLLPQKIQSNNTSFPPFGSYSQALNAGASSFVFAFFTAMYMLAADQKSVKAKRIFHFAASAFFLLLLGLSLKDRFVDTLVSFVLQSGIAAFSKILTNSNYEAERFTNIVGTTLNTSRNAINELLNDADGIKFIFSVALSLAGSFAGDSFAKSIDRTFFANADQKLALIKAKANPIVDEKIDHHKDKSNLKKL